MPIMYYRDLKHKCLIENFVAVDLEAFNAILEEPIK